MQPSFPKRTAPGENEAPHLQAHNGGESVQTLSVASPLSYDFAFSLLLPLQGTAAPCPSPARGQEMPLLSWPTRLFPGTLSHVSPLQRSSARLKGRHSPHGVSTQQKGLDLLKPLCLGKLLPPPEGSGFRQAGTGSLSAGTQGTRNLQPICQESGLTQQTSLFLPPPPPPQDFPIAASAAALQHRHPATKAAFCTLLLEVKENKTNNI